MRVTLIDSDNPIGDSSRTLRAYGAGEFSNTIRAGRSQDRSEDIPQTIHSCFEPCIIKGEGTAQDPIDHVLGSHGDQSLLGSMAEIPVTAYPDVEQAFNRRRRR